MLQFKHRKTHFLLPSDVIHVIHQSPSSFARERLEHILAAINRVSRYTKGKKREGTKFFRLCTFFSCLFAKDNLADSKLVREF